VIINARDRVAFDGVGSNGNSSGAQSSVGQGGLGDGGDINITTGSLALTGGAQLNANTSGEGKAGRVIINARDRVAFDGVGSDGFSSGAQSSVGQEGLGDGGDINITTGSLALTGGAVLSASTLGQGNAGNLYVTANSVLLDNGQLFAATASGEGGNIELRIPDQLRLLNNSLISAQATGNANGGNIKIDTGILIALPPDGSNGSDIIASAEQGNGGRININAQGIFRLEERQAIPGNRTNDIDASSELGTAGEVQLNTLADPSRGLSELPEQPVDPTRQLTRECAPRGREGNNEFIITGRGGLPPNPRQVLRSRAVEVDWVTLDASANNPTEAVQNRGTQRRVSREQDSQTVNNVNTQPHKIVEAQGWVIDDNGKIALVATAPTATPHSSWQKPVECHIEESTK
jgi:large exoprotein involved in heme utilization and adhesion